jgi:DNA-binding MarR family transcriptional regulator
MNDPLSHARRQSERFLKAWFDVRQLIQALNSRRLQQERLSATQFTVLNVLNPDGPTTVTALAQKLNVHPATIVRTLDSLEQRNLISRSRNAADRREVHVLITRRGRTLQNSSRGEFGREIAEIFSAMSKSGRRALLSGYSEFAEVGRRLLDTQGL